jgi:diaminopimelate decarboxylase/aspartate kinase
MQQVVIKFGGTSVSTRENWENIAKITKNHLSNNLQPIIVCSALSQASNQLEKLIDAALINEHALLATELQASYSSLADSLEVSSSLIEEDFAQLNRWLTGIALLKQAPPKTRAQILSLGELMLTRLGHAFLTQQQLDCCWVDVRDFLSSTPIPGGETMSYLAARCTSDADPSIAQMLHSKGQIVITQGFIASNNEGDTVLLGRGGSDTSAGLLAAIISAKLCEIWTDVPGIYTANPHQLPQARLLKQLNYDEAIEIASMGAKVLHPNCIPPVKQAGIPMAVKCTRAPEHCGTQISNISDGDAPPIKSIQIKQNIILVSIDALQMWQQVGFLANIFGAFRDHGFSVDLLSSSEFNITVSLDSNAKIREKGALEKLINALNQFGKARVIESCSAVSLVGHHIRTILPQLGPTLEVFEAQQVYLMSLASNDLNLTFVVDESQADKLSQKLHHLLIENNPQSYYYSKSWQEEFGSIQKQNQYWWEIKRDQLLSIAQAASPCYIYDKSTLVQKAESLLRLQAIDQLFYAIKANPHSDILKTLHNENVGFECVSLAEIHHVLNLFPDIEKNKILFTPNFASKHEYEEAVQLGCYLTIDNLHPLQEWPEIFQGQDILLRVDPGCGAGHHKYVCTGGNESKFGIPKEDLVTVATLIKQHHIQVIGLHAHWGSGILNYDLWHETAMLLINELPLFPDVKILNLGGGLGVVEKPGQVAIDLSALDATLQAVKSQYPQLKFWLEPGRYFVAECGVLLAKVTQCKSKGKAHFIGLETGMNSLIRPSLYGAYHEIANLTCLLDEKTQFAHVVGPICESGDTLGYDRLLPKTQENDILLVANTGAYGHSMSSYYNLREPAQEIMLVD